MLRLYSAYPRESAIRRPPAEPAGTETRTRRQPQLRSTSSAASAATVARPRRRSGSSTARSRISATVGPKGVSAASSRAPTRLLLTRISYGRERAPPVLC